jgi:hypothetical protein
MRHRLGNDASYSFSRGGRLSTKSTARAIELLDYWDFVLWSGEAPPGAAGAALVSIFEFSDPGDVVVVVAEPEFMSVLLEASGVGLALVAPAPGAEVVVPAVLVSVAGGVGGVGGVGVVTMLVFDEEVSVDALSPLRPQPPKDRARTAAASVRAVE